MPFPTGHDSVSTVCVLPIPFTRSESLQSQDAALLPSVVFFGHTPRLVQDAHHVRLFLARDLDFSRLNEIHHCLWLAGREGAPSRSLHRHQVYGRTVVPCEQADMHLLWRRERLFVKPCPRYLLNRDFWEQHLCHDASFWADAIGFLLSYTWLVQRESDLRIAHREGLLPETITWEQWVIFAAAIHRTLLLHGPEAHSINPRFRFGDLRLSRVDWLYVFQGGAHPSRRFINGYHNEHQSYVGFLRANTAGITVATIYLALVLQAMQVGLDTSLLGDSGAFQSAAAYFALISILGPTVILAALVFMVMGYVFVWNLVSEVKRRRRGRPGRVKKISAEDGPG